jgi:hypothetical protein
MTSKASEHIANALREFIDDVGIPNKIICDLATEQVGVHTPVMEIIRRFHIKTHFAEKGRSNLHFQSTGKHVRYTCKESSPSCST